MTIVGDLVEGRLGVLHVRRPPRSPRCRHPWDAWHHDHYAIAGRRFCRIECACGKVVEEGQVGHVVEDGIPCDITCYGVDGEVWGP